MTEADQLPFFELIDTTYELIGKTPAARIIGARAKKMMFEDLERFPFELIRAALAAHRSDPAVGHFTPSPAHIVAQIDKRRTSFWPTADEAWAMISKPGKPIKQRDGRIDYKAAEPPPCVMTQEMAQALAVALPQLEDGDKIAARMAFKGCYDRLVDRAKLERRPPEYFVSPGGTWEDQQAAIDEGIRKGLLAAGKKVEVFQLPNGQRTIGAKPDLKALLLSLNPKQMPPPEAEDYAK